MKRGMALGGLVALLLAGVTGYAAGQGAAPAAPVVQAQSLAELETGNRFKNPGFEGKTRPVIFGEVNVFEDWEPFYCDKPYAPAPCPALRQGEGNPFGLFMGRPEYKLTETANRLHSGKSAQQWFCFWRVCRAGVYQTISTAPGEVCHVSAWTQSWSADAATGTDGKAFTSETATKDQRDNSTWRIMVDPAGGGYAFASGLLTSRTFGYSEGTYDQYALISFDFTATGSTATVYFENLRLWPVAHNDSYLDDASVWCESTAPESASPTPAQPTPTAAAVCPTTPACVPAVVTATPAALPTATRTPAATLQATATQLPPGTPIFGTNVPATPFCAWEASGARPAEKKTYYTYTDPQNSGLYQRIRSGPGTEFFTLEYMSKLERRQVYWSIIRGGYTWWALDVKCSQWAAQLGSIEEVLD